MEKKVALVEPPTVKLPTLRSLSSEVVCSSELLPDDKAVVVIITQDDAIHTSILNTLESRKTTALSCNIGWVYSGQLGTICLVLIDTCGSRGVHIQGVLQALEPKAVFVLGFCHEFNDKHLAGDIFICNEVHTSDGVQSCNEGLVKLVKMLKYGWNPPGSRDQCVHTGSAQCAINGNGSQLQHTGVVDLLFSSTVAAEIFTLLEHGSVPWTAVCGILPYEEDEPRPRTLQEWKPYTAEVIATFMIKVFERDDIFKVFDPSEFEKRMKSLRLNKPSQESSVESQTNISVTGQETMDAKKNARVQARKPAPPLKYAPLPDIGAAVSAPAQANELRSVVRSEVLDVLSNGFRPGFRGISQHDNEAMTSAGDIPKKKPTQKVVTGERQLADVCLPYATAHVPDHHTTCTIDAACPDRKLKATRIANNNQATGTSSADPANVLRLAESGSKPYQEGEMAFVESYSKRSGTSSKDSSNQGVDRGHESPEVTYSVSPKVLLDGNNLNDRMPDCERGATRTHEGSPAIDSNLSEVAQASERVSPMVRGTTLRLEVPIKTTVPHGDANSVAPFQLGDRAVQNKGSSTAAQPRSPPCRLIRPRSVSMGARTRPSSRSNEQSTVSFPAVKKQ